MADYYLHKTAAHIDELLEKVEGLNNYDDTEVRGLINNKVDKETGKGLSTNDFTDAYKTELDGLDTVLDSKVDKVIGKGLSTNDYTTPEKTKLNGIESGANVNVQADWNQITTTADDYIKNKPAIPDAQIQSDWNQTNTESKDFIKNKPTLGSAASKNYTASITSDSNDLVTSGAVYSAVSTKADLVDGKVPASQLPSYVDDVVEYASVSAFPETGESGKIYISTDTNKTYRWGGSAYVEISESLTLGETASTAYAGKKGKANADAIAAIKDGTSIDSFADVETALTGKADKSTTYTKGQVDTALATKLNTADVDAALSDTSTNPVQNKAIQAPLAVLVGKGSKNLVLDFGQIEHNGCIFTYGSDGRITVTGTKSTALAMVDIISNQNLSNYGLSAGDKIVAVSDNGNVGLEVIFVSDQGTPDPSISVYNETRTITIPSGRNKWYLRLQIKASITGTINESTKPMVCDKKLYDIDPTVTPYAKSNYELTRDARLIPSLVDRGAKNLLHLDNVYVLAAEGVTFVVNPDGTISTNGTATGDAFCSLALGGTSTSDQIYIDRFCDGNHILAGCPAGGNYDDGYSMYAASGSYIRVDEGNGILLDSSVIANIRIIIMIRQGTNADGLVFKPMICTKADWNMSNKYHPYAPTNRELYEMILALQNAQNGG